MFELEAGDGTEDEEAAQEDPNQQPSPRQNFLLELMEADVVNWNHVIDRLQTHPHEAAFSSRGMGYSAINKALWKRAPLAVIKAIVNAHPQSVFSRSTKGVTPLHIAVIFGTSSVIQFVYEANPEAASHRTLNGTVPLHGAKDKYTTLMLIQGFPRGVCVRGYNRNLPLHAAAYSATASPEVVKLLIGAGKRYLLGGKKGNGGVLVANEEGDTPLSLVCRFIETRCGWQPLNHTGLQQWAKLISITRAAYAALEGERLLCNWSALNKRQSQRGSRQRRFQILHSVIALRCPPVIVWHALHLYPRQSQEQDQQGRYPLTIASMDASTESRVFNMLLRSPNGFAEAAAVPARGNGRLPLTLSIAAGREYDLGLRELLCAAPNAIEAIDPVTGLYPFQLAAVGDGCSTDTVYKLLMEAPCLVNTECNEGSSSSGE